MTKIAYTYEIIAVDGAARCMEIVYSSPGRPTYHIGARLPYDGETTEAVVRMYAPVANWREADTGVLLPQVGTSGEMQDGVNPDDPVVFTQAEQEAKRQAAYTAEADPLFFKWQAGEGTEEEWKAKRQEIRDRYPYPAE